MRRNGWANDEASFHFEKHIDGIVYGPITVLNRLKQMRKSLYHKGKNEDAKNDISNFDLIKNQLLSRRDVSFDKALLTTLTKHEKSEADKLMISEILAHNRSCYRYIDCLNSVKALNKNFISTLTGASRYEVLKGIYLVNRSRRALNEIAAAAYREVFCFDLLVDIYHRTKKEYVLKIINTVYSQNQGNPAYEFSRSKLQLITKI